MNAMKFHCILVKKACLISALGGYHLTSLDITCSELRCLGDRSTAPLWVALRKVAVPLVPGVTLCGSSSGIVVQPDTGDLREGVVSEYLNGSA